MEHEIGRGMSQNVSLGGKGGLTNGFTEGTTERRENG